MPTLDDIPEQHRARVEQLFHADNLCFLTAPPDDTPTYHFAAGGITCLNTATLCGRLCARPPNGPMADVTQSTKQHMFFVSVHARNAAFGALGVAESQAALDGIVAKCRTAPQAGDYHLEFVPQPRHGRMYSQRHVSDGQVALSPRLSSDADALGMVADILAANGRITVDGLAVV